MKYKGYDIYSESDLYMNIGAGINEGSAYYIPVKMNTYARGGAIHEEFSQDTTYLTQLTELKDKNGALIGIQNGDTIKTPWMDETRTVGSNNFSYFGDIWLSGGSPYGNVFNSSWALNSFFDVPKSEILFKNGITDIDILSKDIDIDALNSSESSNATLVHILNSWRKDPYKQKNMGILLSKSEEYKTPTILNGNGYPVKFIKNSINIDWESLTPRQRERHKNICEEIRESSWR